jgi:NAD-dependent SIR2 family protein deacetylase
MKLGDLAPWVATGVSGVAVILTGLKLRDERGKDSESREEKDRLERERVNNSSSERLQKIVDAMISERVLLLSRLDAQDKKLDDMRTLIDDLHDAAIRDKRRIEQLQGELRQEKQLKSSSAAMRARDAGDQSIKPDRPTD